MRMLRLLPLALLVASALAAPSRASAQGGPAAVQVVAREEGSGLPIAGAQVTVNGVGTVAVSDSMGRAHGAVARTGPRLVRVQRVGYLPESFTVEFRPGEAVEAEVDMQRAPVELAGLTVRGLMPSTTLRTTGFYDRRQQGFGSFVDSEELYRRKDSYLSSLMRTIPGVTVQYCTDPLCAQRGYRLVAGGSTGSMRTQCVMRIFLDGMQVQNEDIDQLNVRSLEGVEVYLREGGMPVQFAGTGSACGVVLLWTRAI
ncbi:MAG: TonB-dependent receptor [Gemmatimonadota bacterium]